MSQISMEVYATDSGSAAPLKKVAVINNPNPSLKRGLIWMDGGASYLA